MALVEPGGIRIVSLPFASIISRAMTEAKANKTIGERENAINGGRPRFPRCSPIADQSGVPYTVPRGAHSSLHDFPPSWISTDGCRPGPQKSITGALTVSAHDCPTSFGATVRSTQYWKRTVNIGLSSRCRRVAGWTDDDAQENTRATTRQGKGGGKK